MKWLAQAIVGFKVAMRYRFNFLVSLITVPASVLIYYFLWSSVFGYTGQEIIRGFTLNEMIGYYVVSMIAGCAPCQPFSTASAGKRYGEAHDSYLWPEMLRIVSEFKPTWVIGENVIGIDGMALERVVSDLEASGYEVAPPFEIPACAVGHDHRRARIWFLAHSNGSSESGRTVNAKASELSRGDSHAARMGAQDGLPRKMDRHRLKALGNAVVPQIPEYIGRAIMECEA